MARTQLCPSLLQRRHGAVTLPLPQPPAAAELASTAVFSELSSGTARKYIMISGKGGVGKDEPGCLR